MRPLYVVGTHRNVGKTTFCLGLIHALRQRGLRVAYTKPLGQRVSTVAGHAMHDDALVVSRVLSMGADTSEMAVPLTPGRVEKELYDLNTPELMEKVQAICCRLQAAHDALVVESMGHVAMGSVLKLSAADVARAIGARALLIGGGGIGRAIDDISLCATFLTAKGANLMGAVVNRVWVEKYDRVHQATTKGLENLGIRSFGTVPYQETLASPTVGQVAQQLRGKILSGTSSLGNRVGKTVVAAMEAHHMISYLKDRALVITPGDRSDNILAILSMHMLATGPPRPVSGIIMTGGFVPTGDLMNMLVDSGLPAILCAEDTYTLAARLQETVFKITPDDHERVQAAIDVVSRHVVVEGILAGLAE